MISPTRLRLNTNSFQYWSFFGEGAFFRYDGPRSSFITTCREAIASPDAFGNPSIRQIGFHRSNGVNAERVDEFFKIIHRTLGIRSRLTIHRALGNRAIVIDVPSFWLESGLRRAVFTLLLRCAAVYYENDIDDARTEYELLDSVKDPIDRFLRGHTCSDFKITSDFVSRFMGRRADYITRHLFKPKRS